MIGITAEEAAERLFLLFPETKERYNLKQLDLWLGGKISYSEMYENIRTED